MNLDILLKASAILLVSWSAVGVDKLEEPKLDSNRAKKRLSTWKVVYLDFFSVEMNTLTIQIDQF